MCILFEWYQYFKDEMVPETFKTNEIHCKMLEKHQFIDCMIDTKMMQLDSEYTKCLICFDSMIGSENFLLLNPCMHPYCKTCMVEYCEGIIKSGQIEQLKCPFIGEDGKRCLSNVREKDLQIVGLSQESLEKYNQFSFSKAVD